MTVLNCQRSFSSSQQCTVHTKYLDLTLHELSQYGLSMELIRNNSLDIKKKFRKIIIKYYIAFLSRICAMFKRYI